MSEKTKYRMGRGEKIFLSIIVGMLLVGILSAVAIPALLHRRDTARTPTNTQKGEDPEMAFYARALKMVNRSPSIHATINLTCRAYGAPHVSIVRAAQYPDMALITIVWPTVRANQLMINPDDSRVGVVPPMLQQVRLDSIPSSTTNWNCRVDDYGNIVLPSLERACLPDPPPNSTPQPTPPPSGADLNQPRENGGPVQVKSEAPPVPATTPQVNTWVSLRDVEEILPQPVLTYPSMARMAKVQGTVQVEVTISAEGTPINAVFMNGPEMLRKASEEWQMKRRFKPPMIQGKNLSVKVVMTMNYSLRDAAAHPEPASITKDALPSSSDPTSSPASGDQPARVLSRVEPSIPARARQLRWELNRDHLVMLKIFIDEQGHPLKVSVIEGVPGNYGFDDAAIEAAKKSTFAPAMKNGHPVRAWLEMRVVIPKISQ